MDKKLLILGSLSGGIAVILGAFAAHGLKELISPESIESFQTGVRYQMYHALLCLVLGSGKFLNRKSRSVIFYLVLSGMIFFSGSIYLLATNDLTGFDFKVIGFITPVGGSILIIAWIMLFLKAVKINVNN